MGLLGADQEPGGSRHQARGRRPLDRGTLLPEDARALAKHPAPDDGPGPRAVPGKGGERFAGEPFHGTRPIPVELPQTITGANVNPDTHGSHDTRRSVVTRARSPDASVAASGCPTATDAIVVLR